MHRLFTPLAFLLIFVSVSNAEQPTLRVGVVGLTHDHVHAVLRRHKQGDLQIVGIAEPNRTLVERHAKRYGFDTGIVFDSVDAMLDATKPEVVSDYGSIYGHLATVEKCAPRGIDVMVEKTVSGQPGSRAKDAEAGRQTRHSFTYQLRNDVVPKSPRSETDTRTRFFVGRHP